tara:strand:- start:223 stop:837 length:615 start_codon:yes stop_codon:yes gene_type:complete
MADKNPTVKAHRGFIHIPRRGGPRRPIRPIRRNPVNLGNLGYFGRLPKGMQDLLLAGRRIPIRQPVRPPRGPRRPRGPRVDPSPDIRRDPKKLKDFMRRQRERDRRLRELENRRRRTTGTPTPEQRALMKRQLDALARERGIRKPPKNIADIFREQQKAAKNFIRLRDIAFRRSASAQKRAKGGMSFKSKDYVNPSNIVDNKKK